MRPAHLPSLVTSATVVVQHCVSLMRYPRVSIVIAKHGKPASPLFVRYVRDRMTSGGSVLSDKARMCESANRCFREMHPRFRVPWCALRVRFVRFVWSGPTFCTQRIARFSARWRNRSGERAQPRDLGSGMVPTSHSRLSSLALHCAHYPTIASSYHCQPWMDKRVRCLVTRLVQTDS